MARQLTGFKPTGHLHLGNYFGAIRPILDPVRRHETVVFLADLHALTVEHDPARIRNLTCEAAALLLAAGVEEDGGLMLAQSHVPEHAELHYLLECATGYGEARRMIQFREKSAEQQHVRLSLLTYPVLMAADILLYDTEEVPVGDDQSQHVELTRDVAYRFNTRYGRTFVVPRPVHPPTAARLKDLTDPAAKMGKTTGTDAGVLFLLDTPDVLRRKVMRAVTDTGSEVRYDPERKPGVSNLLTILAACVDDDPARLAALFDRYGELKEAVADAVVSTVEPIRARYADLARDEHYVYSVLRSGAKRAREQAAEKVRAAKSAIGLLPA